LSTGNLAFPLYYYVNNDIVSSEIRNDGSWNIQKVHEIIEQAEANRKNLGLERDEVTFVDIGANIGWFSTLMAYLGYQVLSFEPMPQNEIILRKNHCAFHSKPRKNKWVHFNQGLGAKKDVCKIISHDINVGDGITLCGENITVPLDYSVRAAINVEKLDEIIPAHVISSLHISVVKIDVENYEKFVVMGGEEFFRAKDLKTIFIEFLKNQSNESHERNVYVYNFLTEIGFTISLYSNGPALTFEQVMRSINSIVVDVVAWKDSSDLSTFHV